jgi:hypothetical protein
MMRRRALLAILTVARALFVFLLVLLPLALGGDADRRADAARYERSARKLARGCNYQQRCDQDFHLSFSELPLAALGLQHPCQPAQRRGVAWNLLFPASP